MQLPRLAFPALLGLLAACSGTPAGSEPAAGSTAPAPAGNAWAPEFSPPWSHDAGRLHLEILRPEVAALDYAAFMSSREHLHRTLHWGSWPREDATLEDNKKDLARHLKEYEAREAYAYTVLTPGRDECVGCIYLNPSDEGPRTARMAYWVVEKGLASDLDAELLSAVARWIEADWPLDAIVLPLHVDNERGAELARDAGFEHVDTEDDTRVLRWERG